MKLLPRVQKSIASSLLSAIYARLRVAESGRATIRYAIQESLRLGANVVTPEHFLLALVSKDEPVRKILTNIDVDPDQFYSAINNCLRNSAENDTNDLKLSNNLQLSTAARHIIDVARQHAKDSHSPLLSSEHLLLASIQDRKGVAGSLLLEMKVDYDTIRRTITKLQT